LARQRDLRGLSTCLEVGRRGKECKEKRGVRKGADPGSSRTSFFSHQTWGREGGKKKERISGGGKSFAAMSFLRIYSEYGTAEEGKK